ncbi:hypothetical protein N0V88_006526 [Collariella sp. IMI 366227]|nr:hypothetical protein N0V88_006526 [Collariella sp. IMI 366227]
MASLFSAQLHPGRALGFLVLGASLHDILTRLKAEPQRFPKLDLMYTPTDPVKEQVVVGLPANGIRLRFDGPEQRLRLIEVIDFSKNHIFLKPANDKERDLVRPSSTAQGVAVPADPNSGPTFRHIYQRFLGPTYDGEYMPDAEIYVLSYPGVAFTFPMKKNEYSSSKDVVSLLPSAEIPNSMAVFSGESWAQARETMWTEILPSIKTFTPLAKGKDVCPDEVSLVKIHGGGKLQLFRKWTNNFFWIFLGETTPQQLVAELGPPDAIYRKNDQRMYIHKLRAASNTMARPNGNDLKRQDDLTDTDASSHPASDEYDDSADEAIEDDLVANVSGECFYNYFYLGFDVLVSTPTAPPPFKSTLPDRQVATKLILHGNVPGSYPFNRHRRCRWEISYLSPSSSPSTTISITNSETPFPQIEERLREAWKDIYPRKRRLNKSSGDGAQPRPNSKMDFTPPLPDSYAYLSVPQDATFKEVDDIWTTDFTAYI